MNTHRHPTALLGRHLAMPLEAILIAVGVVVLLLTSSIAALWTLSIWVITAFMYIGLSVRHLHRAVHRPELNVIPPPQQEPLRGTWNRSIHLDIGIVILASLMGVFGAATVLRNADVSEHVVLSRIVAVLTIIGAWTLVQFGFSRLYADSWFHPHEHGGLDFPNCKQPGLVEFAYFAFSVGATFQTSDTNVTSTHMRWLVTVHAILCFLYNSVLLAFAVSLILGR